MSAWKGFGKVARMALALLLGWCLGSMPLADAGAGAGTGVGNGAGAGADGGLSAAASADANPTGFPMPGGVALAWADNLENKAVPTDDTGVVSPAEPEGSAEGAEGGATEGESSPGAAPSQGEAAAPTAPDANAPADGPEDAGSAADGTETGTAPEGAEAGGDEAAAPEEAPPIADPVFGTGVNRDNLVNPQQKPDSSFIYDTSIDALQTADPYLNDQTVQVTGEVVGDRIKAEFDPGFCWIVLQADDRKGYAEVPVFLDQALTELITVYGAYGRKGTTLQVRGTFHLSCPEHEGLTDLHADTVGVVDKGFVTERAFELAPFLPGLVLVVVGAIMLLVFHRMREGQR